MLAAGAQAALDVRSAHVTARFETQKYILELHHAAVGEQQRRVVGRNERSRRNDRVSVRGEIVEKLAANVVGFHRGNARSAVAAGGANLARRAANSIC